MKLSLKLSMIVGIIALGLLAGALIFYTYPLKAFGNPSYISNQPCYADGLTSATSTMAWLSPGKGTTTIGHTTLCDVTIVNNTVPSTLNLILQHEASSTVKSTVDFQIYSSFDGKQWTETPIETFTSVTATTTQKIFSSGFKYQSYISASTTDVWTGKVTASTTIMYQIPNPGKAKYYKVIFTTPIGALNSSIWAALIPNNEAR